MQQWKKSQPPYSPSTTTDSRHRNTEQTTYWLGPYPCNTGRRHVEFLPRSHSNSTIDREREQAVYPLSHLRRYTKSSDERINKPIVYVDLPQYLAKSPDQQTFIELSAEMVGLCRSTKKSICPISRAVSRKNKKRDL